MPSPRKTIIATEKAPQAIGPYSQAVRASDLLFLSGQLGVDPQTGEFPESFEDEVRQVMANLQAVLEAAGATLADVVKTTVFLDDLSRFAEMNAIYAEYFTDAPPARATVQVAALPKNARLEIEAVAVVA